MKLPWKYGITIPAVVLAIGVVCWFMSNGFRNWVGAQTYFVMRETQLAIHPPPPRCKVREAEFTSRVERIKRDAKGSLEIGSKKSDVIRFFASEGIPVTFDEIVGRDEATGTIFVHGDAACGSLACGDDSALIGVRVDVDENGTVVSPPVVVGIYTDCL